MECQGIQPSTLGEFHAWFPMQGVGYFGMSLTDAHADALVKAAKGLEFFSMSIVYYMHRNTTVHHTTHIHMSSH